MLPRKVAQKINAHFGKPVVDLFASADIKQVHTINRQSPPMLVPLVLVRMHQFQVTMILITPWWPPELMALSITLPRRLQANNTTLIEATSGLPLAEQDKLKMTAWVVSADPFRRQDCPLRWPHSSGQHRDSGARGVAERAWILLPHL